MIQDLIEGMIALAAYRAMNRIYTRVEPNFGRRVADAAWAVFDPWWEAQNGRPFHGTRGGVS